MQITLVLAYYMNPLMLGIQFDTLAALPECLKDDVSVIVVDDGSPSCPAQPRELGLPLKIFRMDQDVPWNQDACRNLGVREAETDWVLMTDMDHLVTENVWAKLTSRRVDPANAYTFSRVSMPDLEPYKPHPNSWMMHKDLFNLIGGYDERFRGWYGTDGDFKGRLAGIAPIVQLKEALIRYPREVVPDASTTTLVRKSEENGLAIKRIRKERSAEMDGRPKRFLTPYTRIH